MRTRRRDREKLTEQDAVHDQGADGGVGHEHGEGEGARQPGQAVLGQGGLVELAGGEDVGGGVGAAVGHAQGGGHEGQRPRAPAVAVVDAQHGDEAGQVAEGGVVLELEGQRGLERGDVLPVEGQAEEAEPLVVGGAAEEVGEDGGPGPRGVHGGEAGHGDGVEPGEDVGGEPLVGEHAAEGVPEVAQRLGVAQVLPVQALQRLDRRQRAPVDGLDVPDGDGPHDAAEAVAEEADGHGAEHDGGAAQGQVVEEVLRREDLRARRRVGRARRRDGADGVLLERPGPRVDDEEGADPERGLRPLPAAAASSSRPPSRLVVVAAGEEVGPCLACEVGNEDDEGARDADGGGFELLVCQSVVTHTKEPIISPRTM